jgi:hypothetical protein
VYCGCLVNLSVVCLAAIYHNRKARCIGYIFFTDTSLSVNHVMSRHSCIVLEKTSLFCMYLVKLFL